MAIGLGIRAIHIHVWHRAVAGLSGLGVALPGDQVAGLSGLGQRNLAAILAAQAGGGVDLLVSGFAAIAGLAPRRAAIPVVIVWLLVGLAGVGFMLSPIGRLFG